MAVLDCYSGLPYEDFTNGPNGTVRISAPTIMDGAIVSGVTYTCFPVDIATLQGSDGSTGVSPDVGLDDVDPGLASAYVGAGFFTLLPLWVAIVGGRALLTAIRT